MELLLILLLISASAYQMVSDIRTRELSDKVNGLLFFGGIGYAFLSNDPIAHVISVVVILVVCITSLFSSSVGGGDIKMLFALSPWYNPPILIAFLLTWLLYALVIQSVVSVQWMQRILMITEEEQQTKRLPLAVPMAFAVWTTEGIRYVMG